MEFYVILNNPHNNPPGVLIYPTLCEPSPSEPSPHEPNPFEPNPYEPNPDEPNLSQPDPTHLHVPSSLMIFVVNRCISSWRLDIIPGTLEPFRHRLWWKQWLMWCGYRANGYRVLAPYYQVRATWPAGGSFKMKTSFGMEFYILDAYAYFKL